VAQYGNACNFNADVPTVRHKLEVLREHCETVGRDYASVLKTVELYAILGDRREVDRVVADTARRTGQDEAYVRSWHPWAGDAERIVQAIGDYADAGIDYFIVNVPNAFEGGVITRFAEEVFPRLWTRANLKPA
jgi:alkanesulfonate monooxygenase SsuD/methylene tetrahydromethanopterin reductase-like flavin-dependent oxidoreductase (luciferase family)